MKRIRYWIISLLSFLANGVAGQAPDDPRRFNSVPDDRMANGSVYRSWEVPQKYSRTFYVDDTNPAASDLNAGSEETPFKTISRAAQILAPGERVIIREGLYREAVHPLQGGTGPDKMIMYEAEKGANVILCGSIILRTDEWKPGKGWDYSRDLDASKKKAFLGIKIWQFDLHPEDFPGYNPFGMSNLLHERGAMDFEEVIPDPHFKRRGMIFLNGQPLEQVLAPTALPEKTSGAFWVEHNGLRVHVRFPGMTGPKDYTVEATNKEQLFSPAEYGTGYIHIKGITFRHCGNGFPVPQRGMVSSNRGHHWIIEDCTIEWANSVGMDLGNEMWYTTPEPVIGYHIVRHNTIRQCGISGLQAYRGIGMVIEDNLFENIGWQDAEFAWESGAVKIHRASDVLFRRNVIRHIVHAPGIWMDYLSSRNVRITKNVFTDITTALGAIYIEASRDACLVDHNIIHQVKCPAWIAKGYDPGGNGCIGSGTDSVRFENNLLVDIENTGYSLSNDEWQVNRMTLTRGGIARNHKLTGNIFMNCGKMAIELPNEFSFTDGNVYCFVPPGYIKIKYPAPGLRLDYETCRQLYGWEKTGSAGNIEVKIDPDSLKMNVLNEGDVKSQSAGAGPFRIIANGDIFIDPRKSDQK